MGASTTPRFRSAARRTRPSVTSAISPGAKYTRCWRPWGPRPPQPFLQTIVHVAPTRTVFGRVCLLGDAAFVVRPHTAGATAKAARDAATLARALKRAGRNVDAGLSGFEEMQIEFGQGLAGYR